MWVRVHIKLTSKDDFCVVSVRALVVNFFIHSTKQYLNEKYIVTFHPKHPKWDQILQITPQSETTSTPATFLWESFVGKGGGGGGGSVAAKPLIKS